MKFDWFVPKNGAAVLNKGVKITHPPRTILKAGFLDKGEGVLNTTSDASMHANLLDEIFPIATIFAVCALHVVPQII